MRARRELTKIIDENYRNKEEAVQRFVRLAQIYGEAYLNEFKRNEEIIYNIKVWKFQEIGGEYI